MVFIVYPIGQGSFSDGMSLGILETFNFTLIFQAEHNIFMNPIHMFEVAAVFGRSFLFTMHGSLITFLLIKNIIGRIRSLRLHIWSNARNL